MRVTPKADADVAEAAGLALVRSCRGSEYMWFDGLSADPMAAQIDAAARRANATAPAATLGWRKECGRLVKATRDVKRGELLLVVPAAILVRTDDADLLPQAAALSEPAAMLSLDQPTLRLMMEVLRDERACSVARSLASSLEYQSSAVQAHWQALSAQMRRTGLQGGAPVYTAPAELLQAVQANAHRVLDDDECCRCVGIGLYPAACMLNHSCMPRATLYYADGGRELRVRALSDLRPGDEVTCAYLSEEQLYAPWEERRALLAEAHHIHDYSEPHERARAERAARSASDTPQAQAALARAEPRARTVMAMVAKLAARAATRKSDQLRSLTEELRGLLHEVLEPVVRSGAHPLLQEVLTTLNVAARALDEPGLLARYALLLAQAREVSMPLGTPQLAVLYAAHAGALSRLLRERRVPTDRRHSAAQQAASALTASARIRQSCFGREHPLTQANIAALAAANERVQRIEQEETQKGTN
jgi:hypothetical protein